jgi:DNA-binding beta-propeller fold protein YncE
MRRLSRILVSHTAHLKQLFGAAIPRLQRFIPKRPRGRNAIPVLKIVATVELRARPKALAAGEGAIWVFNERDGTVQRIDGKSGKQLATIETEAVGRGEMTIGGGFVWIATLAGDIIQIDPRTNSVRRKLKPPC